MKLQLQGQSVRLRIDEAELARLLAGETVVNRTVLGAAGCFSQWLVLSAGESANTTSSLVAHDDGWHVELPRAAVEAYASQLPCRHAFAVELDVGGTEPIQLDFEVDVRDSLRARGPSRRREQPE